VVENAIQNQVHAAGIELSHQLLEFFRGAKHGVDGQVIGGIVTVVGG